MQERNNLHKGINIINSVKNLQYFHNIRHCTHNQGLQTLFLFQQHIKYQLQRYYTQQISKDIIYMMFHLNNNHLHKINNHYHQNMFYKDFYILYNLQNLQNLHNNLINIHNQEYRQFFQFLQHIKQLLQNHYMQKISKDILNNFNYLNNMNHHIQYKQFLMYKLHNQIHIEYNFKDQTQHHNNHCYRDSPVDYQICYYLNIIYHWLEKYIQHILKDI